MTKKIEYRDNTVPSPAWQTVTAADVAAAPIHNIEIGTVTVPTVGEENITSDTLLYINPSNEKANVYYQNNNQFNKLIYSDVDAAPAILQSEVANLGTNWEKINTSTSIGTYLANKITAIYKNDSLKLLYINIWWEGSSVNLNFGLGLNAPMASMLVANTNSSLYRSASDFSSFTSPISYSSISYGYYIGQGWVYASNWTDINLFLVKDNINSGVHITHKDTISNATRFKFQTIIPYDLLGIQVPES